MRKILITGGTVFVSQTLAEYFVAKKEDVYVLNRNNRPQVEGVTLIEGDRYQLGDLLKSSDFDVVIDANAYTAKEIDLLLDALPSIKDYIFISTSAVYSEKSDQPFKETQETGPNAYWKDYGTNKIAAEKALQKRVPEAYIIRPAYIYGPYNNAYREAFIFDCAHAKRPFYLPQKSEMTLQFIHMNDICRMVEKIIMTHPKEKIYNAGNKETINLQEWVKMCYEVVGESLKIVEVPASVNQTSYFSFTSYQYELDVTNQTQLIGETCDFKEGIKESWAWYQDNQSLVNKRDYQGFIDNQLIR